METIIINTRNKENAKLILQLIEKIGDKGKILSKADQEDFLLGMIMQESKVNKTVSRECIMKKLQE